MWQFHYYHFLIETAWPFRGSGLGMRLQITNLIILRARRWEFLISGTHLNRLCQQLDLVDSCALQHQNGNMPRVKSHSQHMWRPTTLMLSPLQTVRNQMLPPELSQIPASDMQHQQLLCSSGCHKWCPTPHHHSWSPLAPVTWSCWHQQDEFGALMLQR